MDKRLPVILGTHTYESRHRPAAAQRLVNMHAEISPPQSKASITLHRNEGILPVTTLPTAPMRGMAWALGELYAVAGTRAYRIQPGGMAQDIGEIPGSGYVSIKSNEVQVGFLTLSGRAWILDAGAIGEIVDPDWRGASWWEFFDQYFVYGFLDRTGWGLSAIADPFSYDSLDIATAESSPDPLVVGMRAEQDLALIGTESTELWYDAGLPDFPFDRHAGGVIPVGTPARRSPCLIDNAIHFLGVEEGGRSVRRLEGNSATRISPPWLDNYLDKLPRVDDAYGLGWSYAGHTYYGLTIPSAKRTLVYDASTQKWAERQSFQNDLWRPLELAAQEGGGIYVADIRSGRIGSVSATVHTEFGESLPWETVSAPVTYERRQLTFDRFELEIDAGQGLATGQGKEPLLWLSWSDDDGRTWSNQVARSMGAMGRYSRRLYWNKLGCFKGDSRSRLFRVRGADPVLTGIIAGWVDVQVGA